MIGAYDITINDCIKRAKAHAGASHYSGTMLHNKDLRRVVFLVNRDARQQSEIERLKEKSGERIGDGVGNSNLWGWFGLSYASWLVVPRVLLHAMPDSWQQKMYLLLSEMDDAIEYEAGFDMYVQLREKGRFVKTPEWIQNYRHPDKKLIDSLMKPPTPKTN